MKQYRATYIKFQNNSDERKNIVSAATNVMYAKHEDAVSANVEDAVAAKVEDAGAGRFDNEDKSCSYWAYTRRSCFIPASLVGSFYLVEFDWTRTVGTLYI